MDYIVQSRYGVSLCIKEAPLRLIRPKRGDKCPSVSLKVANKMRKLFSRIYITEGVILVLTSFFSVPKVTYDVRMVFISNMIILNNSMWDPNFMLSSIGSFLMMVGPEKHMFNLYFREMFYDF